MEAFIRSVGNISPQLTFDNSSFLEDISEYHSARLQSIEPDYKNYIKPIQLRRMSRLLKMGVTAAGICLHEAGIEKPDAIITGTGLGMIEETEKFLNGILDNGEKLLNPTAFIQSTHNTVGAHIAVMLGCNNYNLTYVHGPVALEHALLDSMMWLEERPSDKVLLGGVEEITEAHFALIDNLGSWKKGKVSNLNLLNDKSPGTIAGEGASFFLLSREENPANYGRILDLSIRFNPGLQTIAVDHIGEFLASAKMKKTDIDLVILGLNGDPASDSVYEPVTGYFEGTATKTWYKHLCGEHYLASSFALWLGAGILKNQRIPGVVKLDKIQKPGRIKNILIHNHYKNLYHSLILVSSC
jgi:3-oxoacyl-(acyl-carrier-protein) synthase